MKKLLVAYILGLVSFVMAITGVFSLFLSVPGFIFAVVSLKMPVKKINIPLGYQVKLGKKKLTAQPYVTSQYLSYIAVILNIFSMAVALFATAIIALLLTVGAR